VFYDSDFMIHFERSSYTYEGFTISGNGDLADDRDTTKAEILFDFEQEDSLVFKGLTAIGNSLKEGAVMMFESHSEPEPER